MTDDSHTAAGERQRGPLYRYWFGIKLWKRILVALVLGGVVGFFWGEGAVQIKWIGDLFVRLIQMIVIPLVFATIVSGVLSLQDPKRLGSLGLKTIFLYILTTAFAIVIGMILGALVLRPLPPEVAGRRGRAAGWLVAAVCGAAGIHRPDQSDCRPGRGPGAVGHLLRPDLRGRPVDRRCQG